MARKPPRARRRRTPSGPGSGPQIALAIVIASIPYVLPWLLHGFHTV